MQKQRKSFALQIKSIDDDGSFVGLASTYGNKDLTGDIVVKGAFTKSLDERGDELTVLWNHDQDFPIGTGTLTDGDGGLTIKGQLDLEDDTAKRVYRFLKKGLVKGLSIGYQTVKASTKDGVRMLSEIKLLEVSIVTIPANDLALVTTVKALREAMEKKDFSSEFAEQQLCAAQYQMTAALSCALSEIVWGDMTPEEAVAAANESIEQFRAAYTEWLPKMLMYLEAYYAGYKTADEKKKQWALTEMKVLGTELKEGRRLSAASKDAVATAMDHATKCIESLKALADEEAVSDQDTSDKGAATGEEPGSSHSIAAVEALERLFVVKPNQNAA